MSGATPSGPSGGRTPGRRNSLLSGLQHLVASTPTLFRAVLGLGGARRHETRGDCDRER
jgi:hypothetical protein